MHSAILPGIFKQDYPSLKIPLSQAEVSRLSVWAGTNQIYPIPLCADKKKKKKKMCIVLIQPY